jgi:hypothetical protein
LRLQAMEGALERFDESTDPVIREAVRSARERLAGVSVASAEPHEPTPADLDMGVGAG